MANEVRIRINADGRAERAFRDTTRATDRLEASLDEAAEAAERVAREAEQATDAVTELGDEGAGSLDDMGDSADGAGGLLKKLGPIGAAAGAAVGVAMAVAAAGAVALQQAISASIDRAASLGRMKAQLLLSPEDAAKYGKIAGEVYANNWGESLEEASSYVRDAALYIMPSVADMDGAIAPSLARVAERIAALAATTEEDGKKVADAVKHMLVTGLAGSVDEAFNLLHAGIARGVNSADDLLDTFVEYSTVFRELGIDGQEAMGLMSQGLAAGARDADTMADALKELGILAQEFDNKGVQDAFKKLGINTKTASADFAAGGARAKGALDTVLQALNAIKDPLEQRAIAIALFGTKAEDLGNALFNMDLDQAAKEFENIGNAADIAAGHMSGNAYSAIEAYRRKWELFQADMGDKFLPVFEKVMGAIGKFADRVAPTVSFWLEKIQKNWSDNSEAIGQFGELAGIALGMLGEGVIGAILFGLDALVAVIIGIGKAWDFVKEATSVAIMFILGTIGKVVHGAALAFGWIPGIGPKLVAASVQFDRFAAEVNAALAKIKDEDVNINIRYNVKGEKPPGMPAGAGGSSSGWRIAASGGTVSGLTYVHKDELIDLGASAKVYNPQESKRMMAASGGGQGGAGSVTTLGGAGNGASLVTRALIDMLRYGFNGPIRAVVDSSGRVRIA